MLISMLMLSYIRTERCKDELFENTQGTLSTRMGTWALYHTSQYVPFGYFVLKSYF
jgi:hypothetical protein